jgi:NAD(P)-dependent dehydrogenase (short-subunit alcohol dehydrogenase family)
VLVVDQTLAAAELTAKMIEDEGGVASGFAADVTRNDDCKSMVAAALDRYGRLDVLDNNVGIGGRGTVVEESEERWENLMKVNVTSMFLSAKHAVPAMIESGEGGAIVNISSISALRPRGLTAYTTSKGAVIALTRAMAIDHGADGIRANCVAPGPVYTPMVYTGGMSAEAREDRRKASVMGLEGSGWDIGEAVLFLASARARFITGQTLVVDGGATLVGPKREYRGE